MPRGVFERTDFHLKNLIPHPENLIKFKKGNVPWNKGKKGLYHHSKETKEKMSKKGKLWNKNNPHPTGMLGKHHTEETKRKLSKFCNKQTEESKMKISITLTGRDASNWDGFSTSINKRIRESEEYKRWRKAVYERDDYTCQNCGKRGGRLNAHHILPFSKYPEKRFDLDNGKTLCTDCHGGINEGTTQIC